MENKFNFSDENSSLKNSDNSISGNAKGLFSSTLSFFKEILDFRNETDKAATLHSIKNDISIKGPTAWILICSIFVASVGFKCKFNSCSYWSNAYLSSNGPYFRVWFVYCY